jgi:hypothetical protein
MPAASLQPTYRRFPGTGSHALARVGLYLGEDHLLQVSANGFTESYRRFFFQDIQALSLYKTPLGMILSILEGGFALMFGLVAAWASSVAGVAISFWILAAICGACLIWNWVAGPTCICVIQTAVGPQRLYSVLRVKRARQLIAQIKPLILAAQAQPTLERTPSGPSGGGDVPAPPA